MNIRISNTKEVFLKTAGVFTILFFVLGMNVVAACSPAGPDKWFTTKIVIDTSTLPKGVNFHEPGNRLDPDSRPEEYTITNSNSDPFYILREKKYYDEDDQNLRIEIKIPDNLVPASKATPTQAYFWAPLSGYSEDPNDWYPVDRGNSTYDALFARSVTIDEYDYILDGESKQIQEDNRPLIVEVPAPQKLTIWGYYQGKLIEIKGSIIYSLNYTYDAYMYEKGIESCTAFNNSMNGYGTSLPFRPEFWLTPNLLQINIMIVILVIIISLVIRKFYLKRSNKIVKVENSN